jgi:homogentisate 1,2-dioxygenase
MPETVFYRNGEADELLFVHEGKGLFDSVFGRLRYGPGDYIVIPIGTTWRLAPDSDTPQRMLWLECPSEIEPPKRYRNEYGQLLEHSPYSQRDKSACPGPCPRGPTRAIRVT